MKKLFWLFTESTLTPWKEFITSISVIELVLSVHPKYKSSIFHYVDAREELEEIISAYDLVVNLCYGYKNIPQSEIAGWLDGTGVPHTSPAREAQEIAQDKLSLIDISGKIGIKTPLPVDIGDIDSGELYVLKPRFGGCHHSLSVGTAEEIRTADSGDDMIVQKYLPGREFTVCIIPAGDGRGHTAFPAEIVPVPYRDVFTVGKKYGKTILDCNPDISADLRAQLQELGLQIHRSMDLHAFSRIDFRFHGNELYVLDVNSMPNLHFQYSYVPKICLANGISLRELMTRIIEYSLLYDKT